MIMRRVLLAICLCPFAVKATELATKEYVDRKDGAISNALTAATNALAAKASQTALDGVAQAATNYTDAATNALWTVTTNAIAAIPQPDMSSKRDLFDLDYCNGMQASNVYSSVFCYVYNTNTEKAYLFKDTTNNGLYEPYYGFTGSDIKYKIEILGYGWAGISGGGAVDVPKDKGISIRVLLNDIQIAEKKFPLSNYPLFDTMPFTMEVDEEEWEFYLFDKDTIALTSDLVTKSDINHTHNNYVTTNDLAAISQSINETVTSALNTFTDQKTGVVWTGVMYDGNLYYVAVTNSPAAN